MAQLKDTPNKKRAGLYLAGVYFRNVTTDLLPLIKDGSFALDPARRGWDNNGHIVRAGERVQVIGGPEGVVSVITKQMSFWVTICPAETALGDLGKFETYRLPPEYIMAFPK